LQFSGVCALPARKSLAFSGAAPERTSAQSVRRVRSAAPNPLANTYQSIGGMMQEAKIYVEVPALFALTALVVIAGFYWKAWARLPHTRQGDGYDTAFGHI